MNIRLATRNDLPTIEHIYQVARETMRQNGNAAQWANGYPNRALLEEDIARKCLYVVADDTNILRGVFYFAIEDDPTYTVIEEGTWLNNESYGVIHRIASDGMVKGILATALAFANEKISNLRIDTHDHNMIMQDLLKRQGFTHCGTIYCHDGTPRKAYQRITQ